MIKVLQVVGTMNRGGAEVMLMDILRNKPDGIHFDFLVNNPPNDLYRKGTFDEEIRSKGCEIRYIGTQLRLGPIKYIKQFKRIIEEVHPDVVHAHLNAKCGIIALAAHIAGCRRIITHCHADIRFRGPFLSRILSEIELFLQKFLIAWFATDWWGCSVEANKRLYWPWIRKKSIVINNAIDLSAYKSVKQEDVNALKASYGFAPDTLILGNVGRIVPHKNIAFILEVMNELRSRGKDVGFVVVGRDDSPEYTKQMITRSRELGIPDNRLLFLGERGDIPMVMNTFDVFVGPALKEGFGLVAVEAQAAGVPCVLYTGFPESVNMHIRLCTRIDSFNRFEWADCVERYQGAETITRDEIGVRIRVLGFDAVENANHICKLYIEA